MKRRVSLCLLLAFTLVTTSCAAAPAASAFAAQGIPAAVSAKTLSAKEPGEAAYAYLAYLDRAHPRRVAATQAETDTAKFIAAALLDMGYREENIAIQHFSGTKSQNIILTKEGAGDDVILVGAHYDSVDTNGADDNASGVALALATALRFVDEPLNHTVQFVFFGGEETGLDGSRHFVKNLSPSEKDRIALMINPDCIIAGDIPYICSDTLLEADINTPHIDQVQKIIEQNGLAIQPADGNVASDHFSFQPEGIPNIELLAYNFTIEPAAETEEYGTIMHAGDSLEEIDRLFPGRPLKWLTLYSELLDCILTQWE